MSKTLLQRLFEEFIMHDNLKNIRNLSPSILSNLDRLIVNRIGKTKDSCMLTRDIVSFVSPNQTYRFESDITLHASESSRACFPKNLTTTPPCAVLTGTWNSQETTFNSTANILGGMGMLVLHDNQSVQIPVITSGSQSGLKGLIAGAIEKTLSRYFGYFTMKTASNLG